MYGVMGATEYCRMYCSILGRYHRRRSELERIDLSLTDALRK